MRKIDDWICQKVEDAYLWLYDWTGIYLGSCMLVADALWAAGSINAGITKWFIGFAFLIMGIISAAGYTLQALDLKQAMNASAIATKNSIGSLFFRFFQAFIILAQIITAVVDRTSNFWGVTSVVSIWISLYLFTVKIRDRQKKSFKFSLAPKLAFNGSHG